MLKRRKLTPQECADLVKRYPSLYEGETWMCWEVGGIICPLQTNIYTLGLDDELVRECLELIYGAKVEIVERIVDDDDVGLHWITYKVNGEKIMGKLYQIPGKSCAECAKCFPPDFPRALLEVKKGN